MPANFYPLGFHLDHIIPRQHGGLTERNNLALACLHCNRHKGPNLAGLDPANGDIAPLFNPRRDAWSDHFEWHDTELAGKTAVGRVTIRVLASTLPIFELFGSGARRRTRLLFVEATLSLVSRIVKADPPCCCKVFVRRVYFPSDPIWGTC